MRLLEQIEREYLDLHPYRATVEEVLKDAGLTPQQELEALRMISRDCPWFSRVLYMRACHAVGQLHAGRN